MAQPKVFVSHSHVDDAFAERLVKDLRAVGADAWLDKDQLGAGDFQERISAALDKCEWFVLVLTANALASPWVTQEFHAANWLKHHKRIRDLFLIQAGPVEQHKIPALWGVYNILDATNDGNYDSACHRVTRELGLAFEAIPQSSPQTPAKAGHSLTHEAQAINTANLESQLEALETLECEFPPYHRLDIAWKRVELLHALNRHQEADELHELINTLESMWEDQDR